MTDKQLFQSRREFRLRGSLRSMHSQIAHLLSYFKDVLSPEEHGLLEECYDNVDAILNCYPFTTEDLRTKTFGPKEETTP